MAVPQAPDHASPAPGLDEFTFREEYAYRTAPHRGSLLRDGVANATETVVAASFGRSPSKTAP